MEIGDRIPEGTGEPEATTAVRPEPRRIGLPRALGEILAVYVPSFGLGVFTALVLLNNPGLGDDQQITGWLPALQLMLQYVMQASVTIFGVAFFCVQRGVTLPMLFGKLKRRVPRWTYPPMGGWGTGFPGYASPPPGPPRHQQQFQPQPFQSPPPQWGQSPQSGQPHWGQPTQPQWGEQPPMATAPALEPEAEPTAAVALEPGAEPTAAVAVEPGAEPTAAVAVGPEPTRPDLSEADPTIGFASPSATSADTAVVSADLGAPAPPPVPVEQTRPTPVPMWGAAPPQPPMPTMYGRGGDMPVHFPVAPHPPQERGPGWQFARAYFVSMAGVLGFLISVVVYTHVTHQQTGAPNQGTSALLVPLGLVIGLAAGFGEEMLITGLVTNALEKAGMTGKRAWVIYLVAVCLRIPFHLYYGWASLGVIIFTVTNIWVYRRWRLLWPVVLAHATYDFMEYAANAVPQTLGGLLILGLALATLVMVIVIVIIENSDRRERRRYARFAQEQALLQGREFAAAPAS